MAHPKRKTSKTRRDKRRTHYKASVPQIAASESCGLCSEWKICWTSCNEPPCYDVIYYTHDNIGGSFVYQKLW